MSVDLAKLKTEIAKPAYSGKSDVEISEMLAAQVNTVDRETLEAGLIVSSIVRSEFAVLSAGDKQFVQLICMAQTMPLTANLKTELQSVFPQNTQPLTRANILALLRRSGTLAESLGLGGQPTPSHVADARRL